MSATEPSLQLRAWDATSLRWQAIELLESTASADVFFFTLSRLETGLHYWNTLASDDIAWHVERFEGRQVFDDSLVYKSDVRTWSVREPEPQMYNRFSTLEEDYQDRHTVFELETFQQAYSPVDTSDQARALIYDGNRFIGSIAAIHRGNEQFDTRTLDRIRCHTRTIRRLLLLADRVDHLGPDSPLHLVCDETGRVVFADERAAGWLTPRRAEALTIAVRERRCMSIDGMATTFGWLDDGHRKLHHMVLSPTEAIRATRWHQLSETQRTIVRLALDGFSNSEIARLQSVSASTVKYHLNQAAGALDVSGRQGLIDTLSGDDWPVG